MVFWNRLDAVRSQCDVLEHPFYVRWSRGELAPGELAAYSGQYRHAVTALAAAPAGAAGKATGRLRAHLEAHAAEESEHVELWDRFLEAAGGDRTAAPTPETESCAAAWSDPGRSVTATLAALYAIEAAQPAIAEVKREGLVRFYGFTPGAATDYFDVHATLDREHAAAHRAWIDQALQDADAGELLDAARDVLAANWRLLDGVERLSAVGA
jgi:pyrroloquinoline-quinone synthase